MKGEIIHVYATHIKTIIIDTFQTMTIGALVQLLCLNVLLYICTCIMIKKY